MKKMFYKAGVLATVATCITTGYAETYGASVPVSHMIVNWVLHFASALLFINLMEAE